MKKLSSKEEYARLEKLAENISKERLIDAINDFMDSDEFAEFNNFLETELSD